MKLNLAVIVKDQVFEVEKIIWYYSKYFDELHFAVDLDLEKFQKIKDWGPNVFFHKYEWINDFADKRNFLASKMECDYYFTIDTDDVIKNPERIREVAERAASDGVDVLYCYYHYSVDQDGNTNAAHYKERLVRNNKGLLKWNKPVHETIPANGLNVAIDDTILVVHNNNPEHAEASMKRNLEMLLKEYARDKENTDPRTISYLAKSLYNLGLLDRAIPFFELHIQKSGWDEDRCKSWCDLADIYRQKQDYNKSVSCGIEAIMERHDYPDGYLRLHDAYTEMQQWDKAIHWGEIALKINIPKDTMMLIDPSMYTWRPALSLSFCYFQIGDFEKAKKLFDYAEKLAPTIGFIKENKKLYEQGLLRKRYVEKLLFLYQAVKDDPKRVCSLLDSVPADLQEHELVIKLRNMYFPPKNWSEKSVEIFCGEAWEDWSPESVQKGIGGSEEAVIYLSKELVKLGYEVTVYGSPGEKEGVYEGVNYLNYYKFNKNDKHNIVISWRNNIFKYGIQAKKKIVWLHDVPNFMAENNEDGKSFDKVVVLSEYHKSLLPKTIPQEKIFVSANGINLPDFDIEEERNPKRIIYTSSYERGIEHLLDMWPEIKKEVPDAELHVFYGWNTYDRMFQRGSVDGKFKQKMLPKFQQEGVFEHGRVGHAQLVKEFKKSGVWAYPCQFPEISCISAMKAQAAGCVPVCTDFAALKETVKSGIVVPGTSASAGVRENFKEMLIEVLKNPESQEHIRSLVLKHKEEFGWDKVAEQWSSKLFPVITDRTFIKDRFGWIKSLCSTTEKIVDIGGNDGHTFDGWGNRENITTVDIDLYDIPNFVRSNAETLPFEDKRFDTAILAEILEHVEDPIKALKEAKRVAKRVIVTVPEEHEWEEHLDPMMSIEDKEKKEGRSREVLAREGNPKCKEFYMEDNLAHLWHNRHYTKETLEADLIKAGFENPKVEKLVMGEWVFYGAVCE